MSSAKIGGGKPHIPHWSSKVQNLLTPLPSLISKSHILPTPPLLNPFRHLWTIPNFLLLITSKAEKLKIYQAEFSQRKIYSVLKSQLGKILVKDSLDRKS